MSRYSIDTPDVDVTSSSKALAHNVKSFGVTIQREETCNFLAEQTVISIVSDNNVVNKKMCMSLSGSDHLMPYIINHVNNIDNFF